MAKKRSQSREQLKIAGTERLDRVPMLDRLADEYCDLDEQGKAIREGKNEVAEQLVAEMKERNLERYVYEDRFGKLKEINLEDLEVKVTIRPLRKPARETEAAPAEAPN